MIAERREPLDVLTALAFLTIFFLVLEVGIAMVGAVRIGRWPGNGGRRSGGGGGTGTAGTILGEPPRREPDRSGVSRRRKLAKRVEEQLEEGGELTRPPT